MVDHTEDPELEGKPSKRGVTYTVDMDAFRRAIESTTVSLDIPVHMPKLTLKRATKLWWDTAVRTMHDAMSRKPKGKGRVIKW